jgi:hypothetical protein
VVSVNDTIPIPTVEGVNVAGPYTSEVPVTKPVISVTEVAPILIVKSTKAPLVVFTAAISNVTAVISLP